MSLKEKSFRQKTLGMLGQNVGQKGRQRKLRSLQGLDLMLLPVRTVDILGMACCSALRKQDGPRVDWPP